jgi:hypothetical protein
MRRAFFHEDDYCQIEVQPLENLEFCRQQAGEIESFSEEHKIEGGWDAMYVRGEAQTALESLGITAAEVRTAMSGVLAEYNEVETGTFSDVSTCKNVLAFGNDNSATIFVGLSAVGIVHAIWCSDPLYELTRLPRQERLMLADWGWSFICPLPDIERLRGYLAERERSWKEFTERMEAERKARQGH